jgi:hypothetical protein
MITITNSVKRIDYLNDFSGTFIINFLVDSTGAIEATPVYLDDIYIKV